MRYHDTLNLSIHATQKNGDHSSDNLNTSKYSTYCEFTGIVHSFIQLKFCRNTCKLSQNTVEITDSSMPLTRKQKAKERRSRQMDLMSDVDNVDIMLRSYSRDDEENNGSENEVIGCKRRRLQIITQC